MPNVLSDKDIQNLVKKIGKQVEKSQAKKKPRYEDISIVRNEEAPNQEELDAQLKHMAKREF